MWGGWGFITSITGDEPLGLVLSLLLLSLCPVLARTVYGQCPCSIPSVECDQRILPVGLVLSLVVVDFVAAVVVVAYIVGPRGGVGLQEGATIWSEGAPQFVWHCF